MTKTEIKKMSLINFIKWKMEQAGELKCEQERVMKLCKKLSYKALKQWAINNDFIDY